MIDDKALLSEYLSESEQLLDLLLTDLDAIGHEAAGRMKEGRLAGKPSLNLVNRVFRSVHSLKGLSGMMGLIEVQSLVHEFEDILDDVRMEQLTFDLDLAGALQEAGAGLAALVAGAARGVAKDEDFDRFRELLFSISTRRKVRGRAEARGSEAIGLSDRERDLLAEYEEHRIRVNLDAGRSFYSLTAQFPITEVEGRFRSVNAKLDDVGELLANLPSQASDRDAVAFKLIFATQFKESEIRKKLENAGRLERMRPSTWRRAGKALRSVSRIQRRQDAQGDAAAGKILETPTRITGMLPPGFAQESLQPISPSVRVELSQIDELSGLAHELAIETKKLSAMADRFMTQAGCSPRERFDLRQNARRLEREFVEIEERLVELRMVSLAQTFTRAARLAGRLARELGKSASVELSGRAIQVDKMIVERIADPIHHVLRNAIDHGIEAPDERRRAWKSARGRIKIEARLEGTRAIISVSDDGRGIDPEQVRQRAIEIGAIAPEDQLTNDETLRLIFQPGFSTAGEISAVSGRGVGLDAVERTIYDLGGEIRVHSERGQGTVFELAVPTTLQMISAFIVRAGEWRYAVNVGQIVELFYATEGDIVHEVNRRKVSWRGVAIPLVELGRVLFPGQTLNGSGRSGRVPAFVTKVFERPVAVQVCQFEGQREIVVKSLGALSRKFKGIIGAVDLEGGDVVLVLDLPSLLIRRLSSL